MSEREGENHMSNKRARKNFLLTKLTRGEREGEREERGERRHGGGEMAIKNLKNQ